MLFDELVHHQINEIRYNKGLERCSLVLYKEVYNVCLLTGALRTDFLAVESHGLLPNFPGQKNGCGGFGAKCNSRRLRAMQRRAQSCLPNYFSARADTYVLFSAQTVYSAHSPAHQILVKIRIG